MNRVESTLEMKNITKYYGSNTALNDVSLSFEKNTLYGIFGRNGAGKTTLLDIITSRIFPDQGKVLCSGYDIDTHPRIIQDRCCYMPERHYFPLRLKVSALFRMGKMSFAGYDESYADRLCNAFGLNVEQKYGQLSRGHQSIFRIILGLASGAAITIFDEPVLGLDAVARDRFYSELIETYTRDPRLFIIATHYIEESADLFNEAIIIKDGSVIRQAPVEKLLADAFYVSGRSDRVDLFIKGRTVMAVHTVSDLKTAVVEGNLKEEKPVPGLRLSPLTIQKLFIHLTNSRNEQESRR